MPSNEELDIILHTKGFQYRTCWECNKAHKHLKNADEIIVCLWCGNAYYKGEKIKFPLYLGKQVKTSQESNDLYAIHKRVRNQEHNKKNDK